MTILFKFQNGLPLYPAKYNQPLFLSLSLSLSHTHTHTQSERECLVLWALQWRLLRNSQSTSAGASRTFAAMKKWWLPLEIRIHSKATQLFSISSKHQRSLSLSLSLSLNFTFHENTFFVIIHPKNQNLSLFSFRKENPFLKIFFFKSWSQIEQFESGGRETRNPNPEFVAYSGNETRILRPQSQYNVPCTLGAY